MNYPITETRHDILFIMVRPRDGWSNHILSVSDILKIFLFVKQIISALQIKLNFSLRHSNFELFTWFDCEKM